MRLKMFTGLLNRGGGEIMRSTVSFQIDKKSNKQKKRETKFICRKDGEYNNEMNTLPDEKISCGIAP